MLARQGFSPMLSATGAARAALSAAGGVAGPSRLGALPYHGSFHQAVAGKRRFHRSPGAVPDRKTTFAPDFFDSRSSASSDPVDTIPRSRLASAVPSPTSALPLLAVFPFSDPSLVDTVHSLLLSSPIPAGYTIILLTLLVRTGITLPVTLWQRARVRRTREIIVPEMKRLNDELAGPVARECRKAGLGYEEYKKELKKQLATHQAALHKKHATHPALTLIAPLAVHIPVLITVSMSIRRCLETGRIIQHDPMPVGTGAAGSAETTPMIAATIGGSPDGWAGEGFWWLHSLADVDASGVLPIAGGMIAMLNAGIAGNRRQAVEVETEPSASPEPAAPTSSKAVAGNAFARPSAAARRRFSTSSVIDAAAPKKPTAAARTPQRITTTPMSGRAPRLASHIPSDEHMTTVGRNNTMLSKGQEAASFRGKIVTGIFRVMAVAFIPIALQMPSALALYWTTSMSYTLLQSVALDWYDAKKGRSAA